MDYQGNAKKDKLELSKPEKKVEKVVSTQVVVQKKSLGRKFRDVFVQADFRSVAQYIVIDVLLPAFRNTIVEASSKGIERMMYGESRFQRRGGYGQSRITYNNPVNRGYGGSPLMNRSTQPMQSRTRQSREDYIISSRDEAETVLERMNDILDQYGVASVADLHDLIGLGTSYTDNKWGWSFLGEATVRQTREGYLLDLPPAESLD